MTNHGKLLKELQKEATSSDTSETEETKTGQLSEFSEGAGPGLVAAAAGFAIFGPAGALAAGIGAALFMPTVSTTMRE